MISAEAVCRAFEARFGAPPKGLVFSPGRINLIGEHIDYCGGLVMPMAISRGTWFAFSPNSGGRVRLHSLNRSEQCEFDLSQAPVPVGAWVDYAVGMAGALTANRRVQLDATVGVDVALGGNIGGGGLSSSASFTVGFGMVLLAANDLTLDSDVARIDIARAARSVENEFVGVACGIMDQASVTLGGVITLDCAELAFDRVDSDLGDYRVVVMDTRHPRTLAASAYNERVSEIARALALLEAETRPDQLCRTLSQDDIASLETPEPVLFRRLRHVLSEHHRVKNAQRALASGRLERFGELLAASHDSLREDYEVTGQALDTIVAASLDQPGVLGARMTGAGFGGCAIALVHHDALPDHAAAVQERFSRETGVEPEVFEVAVDPGVRLVQL